jgi:hypothetical protein
MFTLRGEHFVLFRRVEGRTDNFTPTLPLGAKLRLGLRKKHFPKMWNVFQHVEASLDSGVVEGYVVEIQWDAQENLYW